MNSAFHCGFDRNTHTHTHTHTPFLSLIHHNSTTATRTHICSLSHINIHPSWRTLTHQHPTTQRDVGGRTEYKLRWFGFPPTSDSWEPAEHIFNKALIDSFETNLVWAGLFSRTSPHVLPPPSFSPPLGSRRSNATS